MGFIAIASTVSLFVAVVYVAISVFRLYKKITKGNFENDNDKLGW